jgi:fibronectin-binding autotransporter adhesin
VRGGEVTNGAAGDPTATIRGVIGVSVSGAGTVTNYGIIDGTGGTAVDFTNAADRLIVESGATFDGAVLGGGGTLDLSGGTGTITGLGAGGTVSGAETIDFSGFNSFILKAGGDWSLTGNASLSAGQSLTLAQGSTATIAGDDVLAVAGGSVVIDGAGTLAGGGTISLDSASRLRGGDATAALTNADIITGAGLITLAPVLDNLTGGVIDASTGRLELARSTVTNTGLIEATGAGALVIGAASIANLGGAVAADGLLELYGAAITGGTVAVAAGAVLAGKDAGTITGASVTNAGTLVAGAGGLTIDGALGNTGLLKADNGELTITGAVTGTGQARIDGAGVLELDGAFGQVVGFGAGSTGALILGDSSAFTGTVAGLSRTGANHIDLKDIAYNAADKVAYSATTGALTVANAGGTVLATIKLKDSYAGSTFTLSNGGAEGTVLTDPRAVAFASAAAGFGASPPAQAAAAALQAPAGLTPLVHA